jgi:Protein of unknown function (DUF2946)
MGWVRFHRRYGARLGLAALVLQIVLSFGHVHVGNVHVDAVWRTAVGAVAKSHPVALAQSEQKSRAHDPGQNSGDSDDYCAICASIFLASTSLAAQPPLLVVPLTFERVTLTFAAESGFDVSRPAFFRSRAPPLA